MTTKTNNEHIMKKIFVFVAFAVLGTVSAQAQSYYQDSKNSEMLRHADRHETCRREMVLPQVNGYNVYKADLHTHTIFSDGQVLPSLRVQEAWLDGLDIMAVTSISNIVLQKRRLSSTLENMWTRNTMVR